MKKNAYRSLPVFTLIVLVYCFNASAEINEFAVDPQPADQEMPDISDGKVVWQEYITSGYDIYGADISDPANISSFEVNTYSFDQINPVISGNKVVFQDYFGTDYDLYIAEIADDLSISQTVALTAEENVDEVNPAIDGDIVVWQDNFDGGFDVWGADVNDITNPGGLFRITPFLDDQIKPDIYRNTVTWEYLFDDGTTSDWDISATDISDRNNPVEYEVLWSDGNQQTTSVKYATVVWQDNRNGTFDILGADINDRDNPVYFDIATGPGSQENPGIDGNIVVWQDDRNGNWDIYGYNILTRHTFVICDNGSQQINPRISRGKVVWQDNRSGNWNIYAAVLSGAVECDSIVKGDVNGDCKVNLVDLSIMAGNWLADGTAI